MKLFGSTLMSDGPQGGIAERSRLKYRTLSVDPEALFAFISLGPCRIEAPPMPGDATLVSSTLTDTNLVFMIASEQFSGDSQELGPVGIELILDPSTPAVQNATIKIERDGPNGPAWRLPLPEEVPDAIDELAYRVAQLKADNLHETFDEFKERVCTLITSVVEGTA